MKATAPCDASAGRKAGPAASAAVGGDGGMGTMPSAAVKGAEGGRASVAPPLMSRRPPGAQPTSYGHQSWAPSRKDSYNR